MLHRRIGLVAFLLASGLTLSGCETFDPTEWFNTKKPLPGDRRSVFPEGVPGVPQGVPPELVQGYQPPPEPVPEPRVVETKPKPKPRPRPRPQQAEAPRSAVPVAPQQQQQQQQQQRQQQPPPTQSQSVFPDPPPRR
jgi:hypothetical protein